MNFAARCERLIKETEKPVLITSDENVFYFSGFTGGDSFLLIAENFKGLFTDTRYTLQAKEETCDFEIFDTDALGKLKETAEKLGITQVGIEEEHMTVSAMARFNSFLKFSPAGSFIKKLRLVKDQEEIERIKKAEELSEAAFLYFIQNAYIGMTELEAACLIESYMRKNGAKKTSFDTIVASGKYGAMPHALAADRVIEKGSLAVCDFGCVLSGYCSDMTRTVAFGQVSDFEKEVYEVVKKAHIAAIKSVKEGVPASEVDRSARSVIEEGGFGEYFIHSTGHGVGLYIHEGPSASPKSVDILKENMTLTIEPGIYIPDKFGVRIEDLAVVKKDGADDLNKVTKELIVI